MRGLTLPALDSTAVDEAVLHVLYGLTAFLKPALVVEAGTYQGHSACIMGGALRGFDVDGEVWSADPVDFGAQAIVEQNDLGGIVKLYRGDFSEMLKTHLCHRQIRLAFIDSGPANGQTGTDPGMRFKHLEAVMPMMADGGLIVVDDTKGDWERVKDVRDMATLNIMTRRGLSIIQVNR